MLLKSDVSEKMVPPQTGLKEKYFYTAEEKSGYIFGFTNLHFETGLGRDHFCGGVPAQSSRREASSKPFFDLLDIFSGVIDIKNAMAGSILVTD